MDAPTSSHQKLIVWQKSVDLSVLIYRLTEDFPRSEIYGLTSQMRRAAVSIPSNIAEGRRRGTKPDFINFLHVAHGSLAELETQILIAKRLSLIQEQEFIQINELTTQIGKMLHGMIKGLRT